MRTVPFVLVFGFLMAVLSPFTNCASIDGDAMNGSLDCGVMECDSIEEPQLELKFANGVGTNSVRGIFNLATNTKSFKLGGLCNTGELASTEISWTINNSTPQSASNICIDGFFTIEFYLQQELGTSSLTIKAEITGRDKDNNIVRGDSNKSSHQVTVIGQ